MQEQPLPPVEAQPPELVPECYGWSEGDGHQAIREAQAAILREVRPWLAHARTCKAWLYPGVGVCGCGLDAKLAALREGVE